MEIKLLIENKINEAFLRMTFQANKTGPVKIHRNNDLGKYISSRVRQSDIPVKQQTIGTTIVLPVETNRTSKNHFCSFTIEDQDKINDFITAEFKLWFKTSMVVGAEDLNISKSDIIEAIIDKLKLHDEPKIFENLKKYDYRRRKKIKKYLFHTLQSIHL